MSPKKHEFKDVVGKVVEQVNVYEEEDGVTKLKSDSKTKQGWLSFGIASWYWNRLNCGDWKEGKGTLVKKFV